MATKLNQPVPDRKKTVLLDRVKGIYREPAELKEKLDIHQVKGKYEYWRVRIFYSIFIAYVVFYLGKKNISAALPSMAAEFGYSNTQLGILGSTLYFTYAIGKFVNGIIADRANVRTFLPTVLILSAVANLCFVASSIFITPGQFTFFGLPSASILLWALVFFWGCNGWFQSAGFPNIAKSLTYWYSNNERGTKWALWSTSHQVGTFLSVLISGFVIAHFGWRAAFYVPAIFSVFVSFFLMERLRDKPASLGLPDVEEYREPENAAKRCTIDDDSSYGEIFKKHILLNKTIWMLAFAYIFVYIIRFGTEDWIIKYLVEVKNDALSVAAMKLSFLPLCGIAGTIFAGYFSDKLFGSRRAPINIIFLFGVILSLFALKCNPSTNNFIDSIFLAATGSELNSFLPVNGSGLLDFVFIGCIGFFTYGPQMLIGGLCAIESSSKKVASAATGFTGTFGYIGAILSGVGTGMVIDRFSWNGALYFWIIAAFLCILLCLPMWNNRGFCRK